MPVRIRLALHGCTNRPFYHIVVAPARFKRDGRHLEQVSTKIISTAGTVRMLAVLSHSHFRYTDSEGMHHARVCLCADLERKKKYSLQKLMQTECYLCLFFQVGSYDPMPNYNGEALVGLNIDRIK